MRTRMKWLLVMGALLVPASVAAGPRVDMTGESCRKMCDAFCPLDNVGYYRFCMVDLDGATCGYNDGHFLWAGGGD